MNMDFMKTAYHHKNHHVHLHICRKHPHHRHRKADSQADAEADGEADNEADSETAVCSPWFVINVLREQLSTEDGPPSRCSRRL